MIVDGLQCGNFDRAAFEGLRRANVGAVTVTCGIWETAIEALDSLARWRDLVAANADLVGIARTAADIVALAKAGRTAIVLGFQNSDLFDGRIRFVEFFAELGVRVVQLTYNNQNSVGGSCYENEDPGLARFGREVVREMNRAGILIDLSHVGNRTALNAIELSAKPVAITHANASSLFMHRRNKPNDVLKALAGRNGVLGCATFRTITGDEYSRSVDAWAGMIARTVDIMGVEHVAIGTDRSHGMTQADREWMRMGRWTRTVDYGAGSAGNPGRPKPPDWFVEVEDLAAAEGALRRVGFSEEEATKICSGNWLRLYGEVFCDRSVDFDRSGLRAA